MPLAASASRHAAPAPLARSLTTTGSGLLALLFLPLCVLLWSTSRGTPFASGTTLASDPAASLPVVGTLVASAVIAAAVAILALLAADGDTRIGVPASRWWWPGLVTLGLAPVVLGLLHVLPALTSGDLHARPWLLAFLGLADAQMVAAAGFRQAVGAIPASHSRMAALECINPWQRVRHVILPACAPALAILTAAAFAGSWSAFLLSDSLVLAPNRFTLGGGTGPANFLTATYLAASLLTIFLSLWTVRTYVGARPVRPFARA